MSRSTFLTNNEISSTTDLSFHHGLTTNNNRTNETLPISVQSSTSKPFGRSHGKIKRNLKEKRRATGIRPDEVSVASTSTEGSAYDDDTNGEPDSTDHNQTVSSSKSVFTVSRIQSSFENLTIPSADSHVKSSNRVFLPQEFLVRRVEKPILDETSSAFKSRQLEERILALESLLHDKDHIIYDLQHKLDSTKRDLTNAEQQIYVLNQDKAILIKALSGDRPTRSNFVTN